MSQKLMFHKDRCNILIYCYLYHDYLTYTYNFSLKILLHRMGDQRTASMYRAKKGKRIQLSSNRFSRDNEYCTISF